MILWTNPEFLRPSPLDGVESASGLYQQVAAMTATGDHHAKQGRSTGRYLLPTERGLVEVYVKKYFTLSWRERWFASLSELPGPREWENTRRAGKLGIPVPELLLAAADPAQLCKSLLVTRALTGYLPLHRYLPARWLADRGSLARSRAFFAFKRRLVARLAEMTRRLHAANLFHRDLYLCHFFLRETQADGEGFQLVLIDWGRLVESRRARWRIKDLAQLHFSADLAGINRADRLRFLREYLGIGHLNPEARVLARKVAWKAALYRRHSVRSAA